jgi:hypothetical protein
MLVSIGDQVKPGLYRLHSRFERALNFERAGRLVSVVDNTIGPGPLNIVLGDIKLAPAQAHAGTPPSILKGLHNTAQGWIASPVPGDPTLTPPDPGNWSAANVLPLPALKGTLSPSDGERDGVRGHTLIPGPTLIQACGSGVLTLGNRPRKILNPERVESPSGTPPPLLITTRTVMLDGLRYPFTSRHRYNSTLDLQALDPNRFLRNLSSLGNALMEAAPAKSLAFLLDRTRRKNFRRGVEQAFADQIRRGVNQVFNGKLLAGVRQLKGCGFGLTPAGDDFIAGLLIGLHVLQRLRDQNLQSRMDAIFHAAQGDNLFSNSFLDMARRGLLFGRMKDLLLALTSGTRPSVRKATQRLFAVGETSGADLATGLFMTLRDNIGSGLQDAPPLSRKDKRE